MATRMDSEFLAVVTTLVLATLPITLFAVRSRPAATRTGALAIWALLASLLTWAAAEYPPSHRPPVTDQPVEVEAHGYVSSKACRACHPDQYGSWYASYHRTMTQVANVDTVLGPLDDVSVNARGGPYVLERRGDEVWVEMQEQQAEEGVVGRSETDRVWKQIVQTTGSHEEQFYWVASGQSRRLSLLPIMYRLLDEQRWAPLDGCCISAENIVQESGTGRWNRICNRCHATHGMPRIRSDEEMDTHVAELGIACEACHGPAQEHVALNQDPRHRYASHASDEADPSIVDPQDLDQVRSSQVCGQCHGINLFKTQQDRTLWHEDGFRYRPGDDLASLMTLKKTGDDKFWSDGMVRVSGREYNGLVESPCYKAGEMTCLSCHVLHKTADDPRSMREWADDQLKPDMDGDAACTQCHADVAAEGSAHTHHAAGTPGASCMNCHMPYTTYGLLKAIRSHTVSNPSVQESIETGRPNACNQCHLDQTFEWAAEHLDDWYGIPRPELTGDNRRVAAGPLWTLKGDAGQRALMAWAYGWDAARSASGTTWMTPYMTILMNDSYRAVRYISARSFDLQPESRLIDYDFTGSPEELSSAIQPAYNAWMQLGTSRNRDDALLIGADGNLDAGMVDRLLEERDERPVILNE
jgi:hypothetical protein